MERNFWMLKRGMAPVHPGRILKNNYLQPLGLTISGMAKGLGVSRKQISSIINQRSGISPEMAVRLSEAFGKSVGYGQIFRAVMMLIRRIRRYPGKALNDFIRKGVFNQEDMVQPVLIG
jgi:addiction module HigA family antidote